MLSAVSVRFVRTLLLFGFTPRFSQLIHDKRAVRSANIIKLKLYKYCHLLVSSLLTHSLFIDIRYAALQDICKTTVVLVAAWVPIVGAPLKRLVLLVQTYVKNWRILCENFYIL
jgi:hypothetical protein